MGLLGGIRNAGGHDVAGALRRVYGGMARRLEDARYLRAFEEFQREPIDEHLIVLESEGDLSDNAYALYDYLREAGYLGPDRYHVVWAVEDLDAALKCKAEEPERWPHTEFVAKWPAGLRHGAIDRDRAKALASCRWFIYDHNNLMAQLPKRDFQSVIYLSHGCGYKGPKGSGSSLVLTQCDFFTVTGSLAAEYIAGFYNAPLEMARITGYPRLDYLFKDDEDLAERIRGAFHFDRYRKVILWMPTFRQSISKELSEDYIRNDTGLPLFGTMEDLQALSSFLKERDVLLALKLHHLQAELPIFQQPFDNITVIRDAQLQEIGVQLYQFIGCSDALISDYSSAAVDYLLLDRPIVFTLDDYDEYAKSRGVFPPNAKDYMPGYHVVDAQELMAALDEIIVGVDTYSDARAAIIGQYHSYLDGGSAQRVLEAAGIA